jgi:hypothetical protein
LFVCAILTNNVPTIAALQQVRMEPPQSVPSLPVPPETSFMADRELEVPMERGLDPNQDGG